MTEHDQERGAAGDHGPAGALELDLPLAQKTLAAQPFSRLVNAEVTAFGGGAATLEIPVRGELLQQNGFVHGGVLSYAADNSITFAAGTALGPAVLTSGFAIQFVRPATGVRLVARATGAPPPPPPAPPPRPGGGTGRRRRACRGRPGPR
ncbi:PaaI family thioesterase, partial [Streptomyces lasiicapitis]|uniref:PaaI family thioesterase n=1 Tax=Streptomyces lasiicapitis TaxID=1923961 RepID=UPI00366A38F9